MADELTREQRRLLILIREYTSTPKGAEEHLWLKDLPLRALVYDGIVEKVFDWDYSPTSVLVLGKPRFINISQEGEHDLIRLRELGLVEKLRLAAADHVQSNAFRASAEGARAAASCPDEDREAVDALVRCPRCRGVRQVRVGSGEAEYRCEACDFSEPIGLFSVEDVAYVARPYLPRVSGMGGGGA